MTTPTTPKPAAPMPASSSPAPAAATPPKKQFNKTWLAASPFILGGMSAMTATSCIQPIDMVKVRLQLSGELGAGPTVKNPFKMAKSVFKNEGILAFYKGLSAALVRQATYGTARLGFFRTFSDMLKEPGKNITPARSAIAGLCSGALAATIGNPADLALVRMQADFTLPAAQRRHYKNVVDALIRMAKEEGVFSLWKGTMPTVGRAMSMNLGMLTTYDVTKNYFQAHTKLKGGWLNFDTSMVAGLTSALFSLPFDFMKTRIQKQKAGPDGKLPYKNMLDCARKVIVKEGPFAFYKGFWTYYIRVAPHAVITLNVLEILLSNVRRWGWQ